MILLMVITFVGVAYGAETESTERPCEANTRISNNKTSSQFVAVCDYDGELFKPRQCNHGDCWCVYPRTGEEVKGTRGPQGSKVSCDIPSDPYNFKNVKPELVATLQIGIEKGIKKFTELPDEALYYGDRPGSATDWHKCETTTAVPQHLTFITRYRYYYKYKSAYNIPIVSSNYVGEAALKRACYVLFFLLADRKILRKYLYKKYGRLGIIGRYERTTQIPEHSFLARWWDNRARGLGGTLAVPISTGTEENLLCESTDRYPREDIFLHEFSHGISEVAIRGGGIRGYFARLQAQYNRARWQGLWRSTYAMSTVQEYFAEGVQSYFEVNDYSERPNGVHGPINTRAKLKRYDPALYNLVREVFPCGNTFWKRCAAKRGSKMPPFYMNCDGDGKRVRVTDLRVKPGTGGTGGGGGKGKETGGGKKTGEEKGGKGGKGFKCKADGHRWCKSWMGSGYCKVSSQHASYMARVCSTTCKCCIDADSRCSRWKSYCSTNQFAKDNCRKLCGTCGELVARTKSYGTPRE